MSQKHYALPLVSQKHYNTYLNLTLTACVLETNLHLRPWLYEQYINIYISGNRDFMYAGYSFEHELFAQQMFNVTNIYYSTFDFSKIDIIEYFIEQIGEYKCYCDVRLDEYYIHCQWAYGKNHYSHSSLLYGYDRDKQEFLAYTIDKNRQFSTLHLSFNEVREAFLAVEDISKPSDAHLTLFSLKDFNYDYRFSLKRFTQKLWEYVYGCDLYAENFPAYHAIRRHNEEVLYGTTACEWFLQSLEQRKGFVYNDFRSLHFLYEHKQGLLERFCYVSETQNVPTIFLEQINSYRSIVNVFNRTRLLYIKAEQIPNGWEKYHAHIVQLLREALTQERDILICILDILKTIPRQTQLEFPGILSEAIIDTKDLPGFDDRYRLRINCQWANKRVFENIRLTPRSFVTCYVDDVLVHKDAFISESANDTAAIPLLNTAGHTLTLDILSSFPLCLKDLQLAVFEKSYTWCKPARASSSWVMENGEADPVCIPSMAVNGLPKTFWNAQKEWSPDEYLEVDLEQTRKINCIVVEERPEVQRIRSYSVAYQAVNGVWVEIVRHTGCLEDQLQQHFFPSVLTNRLKLIIHESVADVYGYSEPAISRFDAYYFQDRE